MYDKSVRRRRAVLILLVVCSLILLTAYFGESPGSPLHSVQRGFLQVVSPIQEGASRALKPVRDLFGWFGDTLDAKEERDRLRDELEEARRAAIANAAAAREAEQLRKLLGLDERLGLEEMRPVTARVITRSPTLWYSTVSINKGTSDGVRVDQPVVNGDGLVGTVTAATSNSAIVTLITDHTSGVSAVVNETGVAGVVQPAVGKPDDLLLEYIRRGDRIEEGQTVVTAGSTSRRYESLFPPGIPVGVITKVDDEELDIYQRVHVRPFAQLRRLDVVQVLTYPNGGET
ncbi:MAG: rod shape-determining protein MreC [Solirubrobacteraceae bacterium]|nr:rod shape-determining protein MreC [Solirubrobacteraceae bacterium]